MTAEERISDLEWRLERYHSELTVAIQERDRLALDAAWGVHFALYAILATFGATYGISRFFSGDGWYAGFFGVLATLIVPMAVHVWSNGQRMKEVDRLARLPEWNWRD